jgi:N-acetylglucosaminyldiphosphoundecaprenol N-acetyl-beta-D-mannosaminyltransferase
MQRYPVLKLWVDDCTMESALDQVAEFVEKGDRVQTVFAVNPEKNYTVPKDPFLYRMFKESDLLIPDGIGMVLAAKLLHSVRVERVPGCELMQQICAMSEKKGFKVFLYGAKEEVSQAAMAELVSRHPDLKIVGRQNGYLPPEKNDELVNRINDSGAQIIFLALGSPKQENWIAQNRDRLTSVRVCQGIGGTLDVLAGTVKRAPEIYCKLGLEWLYRLLSEPSRIKRQLKLPLFAVQVLAAKLNR